MKEQRKKLNNKGFSLVELIAVIAIMAVLVGIVSPQVIKYIERSRVAADESNIESLKSAAQMALTNEAAYQEVAEVIKNDSTNKDYKVMIDNGSGTPTATYESIVDNGSFEKEFKTLITELPVSKAKGTTGFVITITSADNDTLNVTVTTK